MDPLIRVENVAVSRGGRTILGPMNWTLNQGERWVVMGPNGAGKTTFLQIIGAIIHPTSGTVEILEEQMGRVDIFELRRRIGISSSAFQDFLPFDEKVIDLVLTAAYAIAGRWLEEYDLWDESRAKALLDIFGVRQLADRTFGTLSEGERKRVQIARSLMANPEILLLDEPAAGLDLGGREDILARVSTFLHQPDSPASVIVTHHIEEIPSGTTHVLLLNEGNVFASGEINQVLTTDNLNRLFNTDIRLNFDGGRYSVSSSSR